ncbi:MAG: cytochrome C [Alphaproteobacteria bacterium]
MRKVIALGGAALMTALSMTSAPAAEAPASIQKDCAVCHQMSGPASPDLAARQTRKGPPLFFAGNKFRRDWLEAWLQKPTRIRPAGDFAPDHAAKGPEGDAVDAASLSDHPAVDAPAAKQIADYLMTLTPNTALLAKEDYTPGRVSARIGAMDFVKFKGCSGCHKDTPKYGGFSGPELHTAWQRLQPPFIVSYIRDPAAWEPRTLMPNKHLNTAGIHKLANYLRTIGENPEKAK